MRISGVVLETATALFYQCSLIGTELTFEQDNSLLGRTVLGIVRQLMYLNLTY